MSLGTLHTFAPESAIGRQLVKALLVAAISSFITSPSLRVDN